MVFDFRCQPFNPASQACSSRPPAADRFKTRSRTGNFPVYTILSNEAVLFFLKIGFIFKKEDMVSPSKKPQGFKGSTWSKISLTMASSGMDKNMPDIPHKAFPAKTTMIENSALIFTFEETMIGTM